MLTLLKKLIPQSRYSRNVITLVTGTGMAQALAISISPILTRIYTPEDFGLFALYSALVSILSIVVTGRYELAIILPKKDEEAFQIFALTIIISIATSGLLLFVVIVFNREIVKLLKNQDIAPWLYLLPFSVLILGLNQVLNYWNNRKKKYLIIAKNRIIMSGAVAANQLGLAYNIKSKGLILGQFLGQVLALIYFIKKYQSEDRGLLALNKLKIFAVAKKYKNFPKIDAPTTFINIAANQAPNILLAAFFSASAGGFYYLTQRILQAPISLISSSVLDVFKQKASEDYKKNGHCREIFMKTFWSLLMMTVPLSFILFFVIEDLFVLVFGEHWRMSGTYAQILVPALLLRFIANPLSFMFYIASKLEFNFLGMVLLFLFVILSLLIPSNSATAIILISFSFSVIYLYYIMMSFWMAGFFKRKH
jgi:O-antigen/teichoic acid export membrane protein